MAEGIRRVKTSDLELKDRLVSIQRVTKVTKGGRTFSFSAIVVVGNEDGIVGYGLGKAGEVTTAISKGIEDAKKSLIRVPVINGTIPHEQEAKYGGARVLLKPALPGTGVKAGGAMRAVLESVGYAMFWPSQRVHQTPQPCESYFRCPYRNARPYRGSTTERCYYGQSI